MQETAEGGLFRICFYPRYYDDKIKEDKLLDGTLDMSAEFCWEV